ncbi:MAG: glycerophosphodiester phosphodiesterase family protein [Bacteroidota bacterium]
MRLLIFVFLLLLTTVGQAQELATRADSILYRLQHPSEDYVLAISHRGDWRYAPENSLLAVQRCIDLGVDVVEIDVRLTKDGHLVALHDYTVDRTTNGRGKLSEMTLDEVRELRLKNACGARGSRQQVPTMEEIMLLAKDKIMINLDKVEGETVAEAFDILRKTGTVKQAILKGREPVEVMRQRFGSIMDSIVYMPIVTATNPKPAEFMAAYDKDFGPLAYEMLFDREDHPNLALARKLPARGVTFLAIALWDDLVAGHTDELALIEGPDAAWGWLIEQGANAIMTDRPEELLSYLKQKRLHD